MLCILTHNTTRAVVWVNIFTRYSEIIFSGGMDLFKIYSRLYGIFLHSQDYRFLLLKASTVFKKIAFAEGDIYPGQVLSM